MTSNRITLPDLPSEMVDLALSLLLKRAEDPRYKINMFSWHIYDPEENKCNICFAGALISQWEDFTASTTASRYLPEITHKLYATDNFRRGHIDQALNCFYDKPTQKNLYADVADRYRHYTRNSMGHGYSHPSYKYHPMGFIGAIQNLVEFLRKEGY